LPLVGDQGSASGEPSLDNQRYLAHANQIQSLSPSIGNNEATHELGRTPPQGHGSEAISHSSTTINNINAIHPSLHNVASRERESVVKDLSRSRSLAAIVQKRDNKGRFSKAAAEASIRPSDRLEEQEEIPNTKILSNGTVLVRRHFPGQFGINYVAIGSPYLTPAERERGRPRERSELSDKSLKASSQVRDTKGRFSRGEQTEARGLSAPARTDRPSRGDESTSRSRSRSTNAAIQKRDSKGRFSSASMAMDATPKTKTPAKRQTPAKSHLDLSRSVSAASQKSNRSGRFSVGEDARSSSPEEEAHSPYVSMAADTEPIQETGRSTVPAKMKAKKTSSKSPYFTTAPSHPTTSLPANADLEETATTPKKRVPPKSPRTPKSSHGEGTPKVRTPRTPGGTVSCIPFPPLSAPYFGLIQEKLAHDPFRLLIAVTFLIRTHGKDAIPVFYELMERYPTPESLVAADKDDIILLIRHLGLQNQRAGTYQAYAQIWLDNPPVRGRRYPVRDYPIKGAGRDIKKDEILTDDDERIAWEIGHMTQGPYAIDSWRIFCRDELRGVAKGWNGEGAGEGFQPEWMRVLPEDKELRAYLRWMWLKEGFEWDPFTGDKEVASERLTRAAMEGKIVWDDKGGMRIVDDTGDAVLDQGQDPMADDDGEFIP
jgi:methyl-CpG-binding domain protein 4